MKIVTVFLEPVQYIGPFTIPLKAFLYSAALFLIPMLNLHLVLMYHFHVFYLLRNLLYIYICCIYKLLHGHRISHLWNNRYIKFLFLRLRGFLFHLVYSFLVSHHICNFMCLLCLSIVTRISSFHQISFYHQLK